MTKQECEEIKEVINILNHLVVRLFDLQYDYEQAAKEKTKIFQFVPTPTDYPPKA